MRKWTPLVAACLGTFMLLIDVTIVNVALPDIRSDLGSSFSELQWVVDAYALVLAALVLAAGSIADGIGHKRVYLVGLVVFAGSSLAAGLAQDPTALIAARAVQGVGAAAMFATTISLLHATYTGRDRGTAFAVWGAVSGAAAGVGVVLGGVLTDVLDWRWIFFVNIPISVLTFWLSAIAFRSGARGRLRVDIAGVVTFSAFAAATTYGIIGGGESGWSTMTTIVSFAIGAAALIAFVTVESVQSAPMFPLGLLRIRVFTGCIIAAAIFSVAAFASLPLLSIWMQGRLGLTPLQTGLAMLPMPVVAFVVAGVGGKLLHDAPPRTTVGGGLLFVGAGSLGLLLIGPGSGWATTIPGMVIVGVGVGLVGPALNAAALAAVPARQSGIASGAVNTARQLGFALGIAVLGSVFSTVAGSSTPRAIGDFVDGLDAAFAIAGVVGVVGGIVTIALLGRRAGRVAPAVDAAPVDETRSVTIG